MEVIPFLLRNSLDFWDGDASLNALDIYMN